MKLGVDLFSLRFNDWDAYQHIEYAQRVGLDVLHFSDLQPFASTDEGYLREVKEAADQAGIDIEVGMGSICPTSTTFKGERGTAVEQLSEMLTIASILGSPAVRCYLGSNADRHTRIPLADHVNATIETCKAVRAQALDLGVKIAIENHAGDLQGRELKELIERAGPDYVGAVIDSGNPLWVAESPFTTLDHLAPYVIMSHIRDTAVWPHPNGALAQWVAMGDGTVDIATWSREYMARCPDTNFTLEIISTLPPKVIDYLNPGFWTVYPDTPAHEFAAFLRLVHAGQPFIKPALTANWADITPEVRTALAAEQRRQLERSIAYCRTTLGI